MDNTASRRLGFALVVIAFAAQAMAAVKSKDVVVEFSSDLPEFAQGHTEAMYLYDTGHNEVVLYLEQDHGRKLSILDVTDPAKITMVGQVAIDAPSVFDFVQSLRGSSSVLIPLPKPFRVRSYQLPELQAAEAEAGTELHTPCKRSKRWTEYSAIDFLEWSESADSGTAIPGG